MNRTLENQAAALLNQCGAITLSSINEEGYPRICVISKLKADGCGLSGFQQALAQKKQTF